MTKLTNKNNTKSHCAIRKPIVSEQCIFIGNFTVCGFYFILFILHALRTADDACIVGEIYTL